jgi:2-polyprenyl-3-methyl-5-hydroxy-6-metoxy-1,4-benzoquinol methylase
MVFQSPRMTGAEVEAYYKAEYRRTYQGDDAPVRRDLTVQTARARSLLDFIRTSVKSIQSCLDIGSSAGLLLQAFKDAYQCEVVGIEPGDAYRKLAAGKGLKIHPSLETLEKTGKKRFDLVVMSHVLEHLPSPVEYLIHLREHMLAPRGWLLIEVPNLYVHESFEPAHLLAFSLHTLRETLRKSGYQVVRTRKHGHPNSALLPLYLTVLCTVTDPAHPASVIPERGVGLKRWFGMFTRHSAERLLPGLVWKKVE